MSEERVKEQEMRARLAEIEQIQEIVVGGETTIQDEVIASIVGMASKEVLGVASLGKSSIRRTLAERLGGQDQRARGVGVEAGKKEAILDVAINVVYGYSIPQIVMDLRKKVAARLLDIAGLFAKEINVQVVGIEFPDMPSGRVE